MHEQALRPPALVDRLLRGPAALFDAQAAPHSGALLALTAAGYAVYGLVVGSFSGGAQWWAAPIKAICGALLCAAICYPSLYIFLALGEARADVRDVARLMLAQSALTALLLAGFAPVAWVFSQSSTIVSFMGAVHLVLWLCAMLVAQRLVRGAAAAWGARQPALLALWSVVFLVTALQTATVLRPLVGTSDTFLPVEKKFFAQHWLESIDRDARAAHKESRTR